MYRTSRLLALALAGGCAGQSTVPLDEGAGDFTTDRPRYEASYVQGSGAYRQYGFQLVARFQNRTGETVYLDRCFPDSPGPLFGVAPAARMGSAESAYDMAWACVGHDQQIPVAPGAERVDTLRIIGPNAWDGHTKEANGTLEGSFQLHYRVSACPGEGDCPWVSVRSNEFAVDRVE
jgi:hypothetical protein